MKLVDICKLTPGLIILSSVIVFYTSCIQGHQDVAGSEKEIFQKLLDSLSNGNLSEYETVNEIRRFLARKIDLGKSKDSLAYNYYRIPWTAVSPFKCIELFDQDRLTAQCGFTSYILAKLYHQAGFESYIYTCGFDESMTRHQFVLVKADNKLIVQDAFYNISITDTNNLPKDFFQLLGELKKGDLSNVKVVSESLVSEFWLDSKAEMDSFFSIPQYGDLFKMQVKEIDHTDGRIKILLERNYTAFTEPSLRKMKPLMREQGWSENYLNIYLKPLKIKSGADGENSDSLKNLVTAVING